MSKKIEVQRKLNSALDGGDYPTIDELVDAFDERELADRLLKYLGKVLALKEINQRSVGISESNLMAELIEFNADVQSVDSNHYGYEDVPVKETLQILVNKYNKS